MRNYFISFFFLFSISIISFGQATTAQDFTKDDCDGNNHHLFDELDAGNIILIEYAMNCGSCLSAAYYLDAINNDYEISNPGKVKWYIIDWKDVFTCSTIDDFFTGLSSINFLDGYSDVVYYGGFGMPTVVVLGGTDHTVYYDKLGFESGADDPAVRAAIDEALGITEIEQQKNNNQINIYPNPVSSVANISFEMNSENAFLELINSSGEKIKSIQLNNQSSTENNCSLNVSDLPDGIYFIVIKSEAENKSLKLIVQHE